MPISAEVAEFIRQEVARQIRAEHIAEAVAGHPIPRAR